MSTSNSPAETPDFAAPAETNTGSDNTVASASTGSVLTDRKSLGSGMSQALSWSVVGGQQAVVTPVEVQPMEISERSRPSKRIEHNGPRSSVTSKSPRRISEARGSDQPLTADQRLDQLIAGSIRETSPRGRGRPVGWNLEGSPRSTAISPSMAVQMNSPPRVLTTNLAVEAHNIPIMDITSDEASRGIAGVSRDPAGRDLTLNHEVVMLTQERLTSEFEMAEMNNHRVEAETRYQYMEQELSQEVNMFNLARSLIEEMRRSFTIEDQGCIRRIEMLETQRNEYASELIEVGNQAESVLQSRAEHYHGEVHELRNRAEAYFGIQNEDISRLRHELAYANSEMQRSNMGSEMNLRSQREITHMNEVLSSELLMSKANTQHHETEASLLQNALENRSGIFKSEVESLQSMIESQKRQQVQSAGFTEEEIKSYLLQKLAEFRNEYQHERLTLQSMVQSEGDVAKLYKGRYEDMTQQMVNAESNPDNMVKALKKRLDNETQYTLQQISLRSKETEKLREMTNEMKIQEYEAEKSMKASERLRMKLEQEEQIVSRMSNTNNDSKSEIGYLESETERLRDDRNEHKAYSQQLYEELWTSEESGRHERGGTATEEGPEHSRAEASDSKPRISRREADKVVVPPWPRSHDLDGWRSQLLSNVLSACADADQEAWITWMAEAYKLHPDIPGLGDSGGSRFATIDIKLANALNAMITSSGDSGREVGMEIKVMTLEYARRTPPGIIRGRQIVAMILESFRSSSHTDLAFTGKHLHEMTYPGDSKLSLFRSQWIHILSAMREDDKPRGLALRDVLYDKIKGSTSMAFDLQYFRKRPEGDPEKSYEYLMEMMARTIATEREEKNRLEKSKGVQQILGAKALAAEKPDKNAQKPDKNPKPTNENAAPVLPKPSPKTRPESVKGKGRDGKGKDKGKGKDGKRGRSPSQDRRNIPCIFHFQKGGCSKGKDCQFSHTKKKIRGSSTGPGSGKGGNPKNDRTPSPKPKGEKPCFLYAKGRCDRTDCPYKHDSNAAPAENGSAKAKASPKGKAKAAAAKAKSAAVVVEIKKGDDNGYLSDWSDNDDPSPVAAGKSIKRRTSGHVRKDRMVKIKRNPEKIHIDVGIDTRGLPKGNRTRCKEPRYVKKEFLESETFKHQAMVDHLLARARAKVLNNEIQGRKPEVKVKVGKDVYINVKWKGSEIVEDMVKMNKKRIPKGKTPYAASADTPGKSVRFIMDTGCGHDLISQRKVKELGLETFLDNDGMTFMTANGLTDSNEITVMDHEGLGQCKLHVLNQTPAVLSVGSRCTKEGYTFVWPEGEDIKPVMINDEGSCTFLDVDGDIPYLIPGNTPKDSETRESRGQLIKHLEELTQRLRDIDDCLEESTPKATAGEMDDIVYEPTDDEHEEPVDKAEPVGESHEKSAEPASEDVEAPPASDPGAADDPEGFIEVDVERGESRYAKPGTLKREAKTLDHLMTHRYSNPYCESCMRAKMRHFKTRKGAFKRKLSKFGDLITFDFVDMGKATEMGWREHKELLVIRDRYTGMVLGSPVPDKSTETVIRVIKRFIGERKVTCAYSDSAPSFEAAMRELGIPLDRSLPGRSVTNSIAERNNLFILDTASTCLLHAGLPACFWPFAVEYVSHALNIERLEDGSSWEKMHKEKFKGKMIPFGAKVNFKPSEARKSEAPSKFSPRSIPGVFAGYEVNIGMKWGRKMLVWSLEVMSTLTLAFDMEKVPLRATDPHASEVVNPVEPFEFPLKEPYEKTNGTVEGLRNRDNPELDDEDEEGIDDGVDGDDNDGDDDKKPKEPKPISGDKPELLHYSEGVASDGVIYVNDLGDEVKLDSKGRAYRVGTDGRKMMPSKRPSRYITPEEWKKMSLKEREASSKAADDIAREEVEEEDKAERRKSKKEKKDKDKKKEKKDKKKKKDDEDGLKEMEDAFDALARSSEEARSSGGKDKAVPSPHLTDDEVSTDGEGVSYDSDTYHEEWLEWEEFVSQQEGPESSESNSTKHYYEALVCVNESMELATPSTKVKKEKVIAPSTPCIPSGNENEHREKIVGQQLPFPAAVSRPVSRKEMLDNPDAMKKMRDEWNGLTEQGTFEFGTVKNPMIYEYDAIRNEAKVNDEEIHFGRVHGIMVEKHWQLPKDDPRRKFKGRAVLLGNKVTNQNIEAAFFQDLGNSPATFEAARWADLYGLLPKHSVMLADAIRAYIQADLKGPRFFVELPPEAWPSWVKLQGYRRPVVRLRKALYGHPDSGTMWEQHCDKAVKEVGFVAVGPEWPSTYYHKEMELLLVVYVDDLKMAGPITNMKKGWDMLRSRLDLEPETELGLYLGCQLVRGETKLKDGTKVSTITYDMESFLEQSVQKYLEIVGKDVALKKVPTPSLPEEAKEHPARAPCGVGPVSQCTWCGTIHPVTEPTKSKSTPTGNSAQKPGDEIVKGELAPHAASVLMKLLYAARIARFDLLRSINMLARNVTKWSKDDDIKLHHLMCYVNSTKSQKLIGWVGNDIKSLQIGIYADADYAGCGQSLRSTSGSHMMAFGSHTRFPLAGGSKRQGCVSHSTPEAEIIAADFALRTHAVPTISLWKTLVGSDPKVVFHDDNQGMIAVIRSGQNPTMRHLERTHGISIQWMHEVFQNDLIYLVYEITSKMCADIHTKAFKDHMTWKRACMLINILSYDEISSNDIWSIMQPTHDTSTGTEQHFKARNVTVPTFPYTETPILPPDLFVSGMSSKEGLQQIPNVDPFVVVKTPRLYRKYPVGLHTHPWLRSTWALRNGQWTKIETRVDPSLGESRFDVWAERAVFQFHPIPETATPIVRIRPRLELSIADLFHPQTIDHPTFVNALNEHQVLVTNALLRIVHGGWDVNIVTISQNQTSIIENDMSGFKEKSVKDYWVEEGNKVVRVHNKKRSKLFDPRENPHPTIKEHMLKDERKTLRTSKGGNEEWKEHTDNWRIDTNHINSNGFKWTGRTVFERRNRKQYLSAPSPNAGNVATIPLKDMFVVGFISSAITEKRGVRSVVLIMKRNTKKNDVRFEFEPNDEDFELMKVIGDKSVGDCKGSVEITMWEIPQETPRMVLLCSEETNWFTVLNAKRQEKYGRREGVGEIKLLVVTITVHDDLNSDYGFHKASLSLRDSRDTMFFAGPCTGGSSWARLNRGRGPQTEAIIDAKVLIFKQLWGRFEILFVTFYDRCIGIYMELPRGCQYWNNDEVRFMIEGTESTIHDFDGCCYGLRQRYGESNMYIKKPWRIVSWNVELGNKLSSKCDGRHEHAPCAGRETLHTQIYTSKIVSIILEEQYRRSICVDRDSIYLHTDGSSGQMSKKMCCSCFMYQGK